MYESGSNQLVLFPHHEHRQPNRLTHPQILGKITENTRSRYFPERNTDPQTIALDIATVAITPKDLLGEAQ